MMIMHDVGKRYTQQGITNDVLSSISLTIEKGEVFGIIGLSGAGKSTLIRILATLIPPSSGRVLFEGSDIAHLKGSTLRAFRKKMGMIFQHFNLLTARTVWENISYPLEIEGISHTVQRQRIEELLRIVGLENKAHFYPAQLSGGEKQRVGIARALAHQPQVLLCDEATSALDPRTTQDILTLLKALNRDFGLTMVVITHEMEVVKAICHQVAVLEQGRIVEQGSVSDLFAYPKHPTTKHFLQSATHDIPFELVRDPSPNRKLLRLSFKGQIAEEPIISHLTRMFDIDTNILGGWIDRLQNMTVGTLVVEFAGNPDNVLAALRYLETKQIYYEVIEHGR